MKKLSLIILMMLAGVHTIHTKEEKTKPEKTKSVDEILFTWTRSFSEVLHYSKEKHYNLKNLEKCMIHGIDAFLNCLDPHSSLLDPKTYNAILSSMSGEFFGIGIVIDNTRKPKD
jgi:C-terminal processing protease CtpA/Prc